MAGDPSSEIDTLRDAAAVVVEAQRRVREAFRLRASRGDDQWHLAAARFMTSFTALYSDHFWNDVELAKQADADAIDRILVFLEADPWCFRSGYAKDTLLRCVRHVALTPDQTQRTRAIVLHAVDTGDRREFREICRLAKKVADSDLRLALLQRLRSDDRGVARRALWVLDSIGDSFEEPDRKRVLAILEDSASAGQWWRTRKWANRLAIRYGDEAWFAELLERVCAGGPDIEPALRLLTSVRPTPSEAQRRALGELVLRVVETDDPSGGLEWAAIFADSPDLRDSLLAAYRLANDNGVRERAWLAIQTIRFDTQSDWPGDALQP
jgi:hypothetical protein